MGLLQLFKLASPPHTHFNFSFPLPLLYLKSLPTTSKGSIRNSKTRGVTYNTESDLFQVIRCCPSRGNLAGKFFSKEFRNSVNFMLLRIKHDFSLSKYFEPWKTINFPFGKPLRTKPPSTVPATLIHLVI